VTTIEVKTKVTETSTAPPPTDNPTPKSPTSTPASEPTNSPEPSENSPTAFRDDFDGTLANGWSIVREVSTHWSLTDVPGSWQVTLQAGGLTASSSAPRNLLLRQVPNKNFEIATLVRFTPTSNYQFAGLLIYQDDANAIQLGRAYCDAADVCAGNGIYFDSFKSGENTGGNYATPTSNPSTAYLRLRREGMTYTGYYSEDGNNWTTIGQHNNDLTPVQVGLIAAQAYESETTADFEYFTIEVLP
jgi:beta-xylosidase